MGIGGAMGMFMSRYKKLQLAETAKGGSMVEEVVSTVHTAHAFGTQKRLEQLYDVSNKAT
jgi:ATP-binding cassette subfamily B (MDR/TAP) protein 1